MEWVQETISLGCNENLVCVVLKETRDLSRVEVRKGISHMAAAGLDTSGE